MVGPTTNNSSINNNQLHHKVTQPVNTNDNTAAALAVLVDGGGGGEGRGGPKLPTLDRSETLICTTRQPKSECDSTSTASERFSYLIIFVGAYQ